MKMNFFTTSLLFGLVCVLPNIIQGGGPPLPSATPKTSTSNTTTVNNSDIQTIKQNIEKVFMLLDELFCDYQPDPASIAINNYTMYNDEFYLNFSVRVVKENTTNSFLAKILTTSPLNLTKNPVPIDTINFRGDLIDSYGYSFPNAENYLSTDYTSLAAMIQEKNINLSWGWPFYCNGTAAALTQAKLVNYIDNVQQVDTNGYVGIGKISIDNYCFNVLLLEENWTISLVAIRFFTSCDSTIAPYI